MVAELLSDKTLLTNSTKSDQEDGGGSDSEPSEDNMEEEEIAKIIPIKINKPKKKQESKRPLPVKK